jgi:hypothetical protein
MKIKWFLGVNWELSGISERLVNHQFSAPIGLSDNLFLAKVWNVIFLSTVNIALQSYQFSLTYCFLQSLRPYCAFK